jgi:hypothetical protein
MIERHRGAVVTRVRQRKRRINPFQAVVPQRK